MRPPDCLSPVRYRPGKIALRALPAEGPRHEPHAPAGRIPDRPDPGPAPRLAGPTRAARQGLPRERRRLDGQRLRAAAHTPDPAARPTPVMSRGCGWRRLDAGQNVGALGDHARAPARRLTQEDEALPEDEGVKQDGPRLRLLRAQAKLPIEQRNAFQARRI